MAYKQKSQNLVDLIPETEWKQIVFYSKRNILTKSLAWSPSVIKFKDFFLSFL